MVITLKLASAYGSFDPESKEWYRLIEIEEQTDLETLHLAIQASVDFDNDHLYDFFIANNPTGSEKKLFGDENGGPADHAIGDMFPLPNHKKLFYLFDYGDSWYFRITKVRKKPKSAESGVRYPRIVEAVGKNPQQYNVSYD